MAQHSSNDDDSVASIPDDDSDDGLEGEHLIGHAIGSLTKAVTWNVGTRSL